MSADWLSVRKRLDGGLVCRTTACGSGSGASGAAVHTRSAAGRRDGAARGTEGPSGTSGTAGGDTGGRC